MLAALGAAEATRPTLVVKVDSRTTSIAILDKNQLLLFRTLENPRGVTHYRGATGGRGLSLGGIFSGYLSAEYRTDFRGWPRRSGGAVPALRAQTGAEVTELVSNSQLGASVGSIPKWRMAGVVGALLS